MNISDRITVWTFENRIGEASAKALFDGVSAQLLKKGFIADIPLIFAAIDPCICCAERTVELVDGRTGEERVVRLSDLRKTANERRAPSPLKRIWTWPL